MFEITVVNYETDPDCENLDSGILRNTFINSTVQSRDMVCDLYEKQFYNRIRTDDGQYGNNSEFLNELRRLYRKGKMQGYLKLGSNCAPFRSHADIIKEYFDSSQRASVL